MTHRDIVIAGAGPVGLASAALLAGGPAANELRILIVDGGQAPQWDPAQTDLRVYALSKAAQNVLDQAQALQAIADGSMSPYERMRVWEGKDRDSAAWLCFDSADTGESDLGCIVEDSLIRHALYDALRRRPNVDIRFGSKLQSIAADADGVSVFLDGEAQPLRANLLIGADGARSKVRSAAQLSVVERDYGQQALIAHVRSQYPHDATAWQRFLPGGPIALLPLADGRSSVVWSLPQTLAGQLLEADGDSFGRRLTLATGAVLGALQLDSKRAALPLTARHATRYCCDRIALIGDAAHSVHPLAGQGVNLGLADSLALAREISAAVLEGQDPGDLRVLQRYERARGAPNLLMLGALDGIDRLFRAPQLISPLRAAGLRLVDRLPLLKDQLIRHASGASLF